MSISKYYFIYLNAPNNKDKKPNVVEERVKQVEEYRISKRTKERRIPIEFCNVCGCVNTPIKNNGINFKCDFSYILIFYY